MPAECWKRHARNPHADNGRTSPESQPAIIFGRPGIRPASAYTGRTPRLAALDRSITMGKIRQNNKEAKKQPLLTPKEKKAAKRDKKHAGDAVPLISHH
jgi:hypothetical protein